MTCKTDSGLELGIDIWLGLVVLGALRLSTVGGVGGEFGTTVWSLANFSSVFDSSVFDNVNTKYHHLVVLVLLI